MTQPPLPKGRRKIAVQTFFVILATLCGGWLRFYQLGRWSFWVDEINSIRDSLFTFGQILTGKGFPLFFLLNKLVFDSMGVTESSARLLPAIFGVITIPILFYLALCLYDFPVAMISTTLLAVAPWHIYWSQNARFYTLLLLLYNLALVAFYWGIERDNYRYILLGLFTWLMAVFTHTTAILLVPVITLYYVGLKVLPGTPPPGLKLRNLIPFFAIPLAGYGIFEIVRVGFLDAEWLVVDLIRVFFGAPNHSPLSLLDTFFYRVGLPVVLLGMAGGALQIVRRSRPALLLSLNALVPILVFTLLSPFTFSDVRYAFISLPAWYLLAGAAVPQLAKDAQISWLVWLLPILTPLALLADHGVEDLRFYLGQLLFPGVFFLLSLAPLAALIAFNWWRRRTKAPPGPGHKELTEDEAGIVHPTINGPANGHRTFVTAVTISILLTVFVHPLFLDFLYYRYQHGHRSDWRGGAQTILDGWEEGDVVLTLEPRLAAFYLGERQIFGRDVLPADLHAEGYRIWLVEVWGMHKIMPEAVEWSGRHCRLVDVRDNLAAGRNFDFRVHRCDP